MTAAQVAWDAAVTALAAAPVARRRDALYLRAWQAWLAGNLDASARLFGEVLVHAPGDLFALKRSQLLYFLCGQLPAMLTVRRAACTPTPARPRQPRRRHAHLAT